MVRIGVGIRVRVRVRVSLEGVHERLRLARLRRHHLWRSDEGLEATIEERERAVGKLELGRGHELVVEVMRGARRLMGGVNSGKFALGRNHLPISLAPP